MLEGKRLLITGMVNEESIAYAVARDAMAEGAEVILTALDRDLAIAAAAAERLPRPAPLFELDLCDGERVDELAGTIQQRWRSVDGVVHAVAFAPRDALGGRMADARPEGVELAFRTSAFSLAHLGRLLERLAPPRGGSIVGLDFDASRAWPVYNWMGVCKSALESATRYLARDLGPKRIRVNLVAAGPLETRAAGGIPGFEHLLAAWEGGAPLGWDSRDTGPVADAVRFLLSDLARAITGQIVHVDGGYSAMAAPLVREPPAISAEPVTALGPGGWTAS